MIFYHVSTDLTHTGVFVPRVPSDRHQEQEDAEIKRVCVGESIEDCFTAIPGGGGFLDELQVKQRGYFLVFRIDTEKLGIPNECIILSNELFKKDLVRDAEITNEAWITCSFTVPKEDRMLIKLDNWREEIADVIPFFIYELADEKYEGNYLEAYQDYYEESPSCGFRIEHVCYVEPHLKKGEEVNLYIADELELDYMLDCINEIDELEITKEFSDEIQIKAKNDVDVSHLFYRHANVAGLFY